MSGPDLSRIISAAMKKKLSAEEKEKDVQERLNSIKKAMETAQFEHEKLLLNSDQLYLSGRSYVSMGKKLEGIKVLAYAMFGYYIAGDLDKMRELKEFILKTTVDLEKELLSWNEFDKAFLIRLMGITLSYIDKESYDEPQGPDYLQNVFPYLRDAIKVLPLSMFKKIREDFLQKRFERYQSYCEKKGLLNYWDLLLEIYDSVKLLRNKKDMYLERNLFEKM